MASFFRTYRMTNDGKRIDGVFAMAFIHNSTYHLTHISIYQDGLIDCWGLVNFEEFREKVRSGWVVTQLPPDARVDVSFLASFTVSKAQYRVDAEQFIREVADEIEALNGRPTSHDRCVAAWNAFKSAPSEKTKEALHLAYEAVPEHNRRYLLGDQDRKDSLIRRVLYQHENSGEAT